MSWVGFLKLLLQLAATLTQLIHDRQLISAGEALVIKEGLDDVSERLRQASAARAAVDVIPIDRLRDPDQYERPE